MKTKPKRACLVVYSHFSRDARVKKYAKTLLKEGFLLDIICLKEKVPSEEKSLKIISYPLPRIRLGKLWYVFEYLLFFLFVSTVLNIKHMLKPYNVVHINNMPDFLVFTAFVPKLAGAKIILDIHDTMPELYASKYSVRPDSVSIKLLTFLEKASLSFADIVITANSEFKKVLLKRHKIGKPIHVIRNLPDADLFKPLKAPKKDNSLTLTYMGTVDERFALDIAILAMPKILKVVKNAMLLIIPKLENEGKFFLKLKDKVNNMQLQNAVQILSPQPLEKLAKTLHRVDIGIVLAKKDAFTQKIMPVKLLEFFALGIPVIATQTENLSNELPQDSYLPLIKNTPKEFAESVSSIVQNTNLKNKLTKTALSYIKANNWKNEEKKYVGLLG